jgi:predicted N-formylglutamate amidohydrolase
MREDILQVIVLAGINPLVVPVHGFQFFHQGSDRAVHVSRFV